MGFAYRLAHLVKVPCALPSTHFCSESGPPFKGCLFLNCSLEYVPLERTAALECWDGAQAVSRAQDLTRLCLFLWGPTLEHLVLFRCNEVLLQASINEHFGGVFNLASGAGVSFLQYNFGYPD